MQSVMHFLPYAGIVLIGVLLIFGPALWSGLKSLGGGATKTVPTNPTGDDAFHAAMVLTRFVATGKDLPEFKPVMAAVKSALESQTA